MDKKTCLGRTGTLKNFAYLLLPLGALPPFVVRRDSTTPPSPTPLLIWAPSARHPAPGPAAGSRAGLFVNPSASVAGLPLVQLGAPWAAGACDPIVGIRRPAVLSHAITESAQPCPETTLPAPAQWRIFPRGWPTFMGVPR